MGLFRPTREHRGPDPFYHWKAILFALGAAFGLGGIFTEHDWLILVAVPILAIGVALRWLPRKGEAERGEAEEEPPDEEESPAPPGSEPPDLPPPA